jgi:parallel beta-helix repeat protein
MRESVMIGKWKYLHAEEEKVKMELKTVYGISLALLLIGISILAFDIHPAKSESGTWTVDDDGSADFHTIQEAINAANPGDTIFVEAGTYYEHVVVDKKLSLAGEDRFNTIIDGGGTGSVVWVTSNRTNITGFTIQKSGSKGASGGKHINAGIYLDNSNHCTIAKNNIANNLYGIWLDHSSSSNSISGNNITENKNNGIWLRCSSNNSISGNSVTSNGWSGILILYSSENVLKDNKMASNVLNFQIFGEELSHFVNDVDVSNTVDGKPVYYWVKKQDMTVPDDAGYVALVNCTDITIQDLNLTHCNSGALLAYTRNSTITKNNVKNNFYGFWLFGSSGNNIFGNNITKNEVGIFVQNSTDNSISGNNIRNNIFGIALADSSNFNSISGNDITASAHQIIIHDLPAYNFVGIRIEESSSNSISENQIENHPYGINLCYSSSNSISENHIKATADAGIILDYSSNNSISENIIAANKNYGIYLDLHSDYNNISRNHLADNKVGIKLAGASHNSIFYNNFIHNTNQAYVEERMTPSNTWDDGHKGNYWSDYTGIDSNNDGIGDTPYVISEENQDNYPLMSRLPIHADINDDGKVNIADLFIVAKAFGSYPGHPKWNPIADVANPYGIIDIVDVFTVATEYGKTF